MRSRLNRKLENQTRKNLLLLFGSIVVIIFVLIKFGLPLLVNLTLFLSSFGHKNDTQTVKHDQSFVAPPVLDSLPTATNSAQTNVSGSAVEAQSINLYINDELVDKTDVKSDKSFIFDHVTLQSGKNEIKVKALTSDKKESEFSDPQTIEYKNNSPTLTVENPSDGQNFSKDSNSVTVTGKTDAGNKVTVNGFWSIVDENGNYSYTLPLQNGDNTIKVQATDEAGNTTDMERKVTYSP